MRFFRHGDVLAISLPESLRARLRIAEGDDFEFVEVADNVIALVRKQGGAASKAGAGPLRAAQQPRKIKASPEAIEFARKGFAVLENEVEAKRLSGELEQFFKAGQVVGVRGFDKRYYLVSREFYGKASSLLLPALKKPLTLAAAATQAKLPVNGCAAALAVLKEDGDVIEKTRGLFQAV